MNRTQKFLAASAVTLGTIAGGAAVAHAQSYGGLDRYEQRQEERGGLGGYIALGAGALVALTALGSSFRIVRPDERGVVERLGKYSMTKEQGPTLILPFGIDRMYKVPVSEIRVDVPEQSVITKDKLNATVDGIVYYKVQDPKNAMYNVQDFRRAIPSLAQTTLRAVIGQMTLAEANEKRQSLNALLEHEMDKQISEWGIDVMRVELMSIEPPKHVQEAMNEVVVAENRKIAALDNATAFETEADGKRRAAIKEAEGLARSVELAAEADARARLLRAEAEAKAIQMVGESTEQHFKGNAQIYRQLEVAEKVFPNNTKVIIPQGTPLINFLGGIQG